MMLMVEIAQLLRFAFNIGKAAINKIKMKSVKLMLWEAHLILLHEQ